MEKKAKKDKILGKKTVIVKETGEKTKTIFLASQRNSYKIEKIKRQMN